MNKCPAYCTKNLETCIRRRHSIRFFEPDAVPDNILQNCLSLAQFSPSNSNIQNWRITFARGKARERVVNALFAEAQTHGPNIPPIPAKFNTFRSEMGHQLYGPDGYNIDRSEKERFKEAQMRNFRFFDAPLVGVITMDKSLTTVDAMSVGMFIQTFMLALTAQGLGTCLQVSVTGFPKALRCEFSLDDEQEILCGIAVGYPVQNNKVNELVIGREDVNKGIRILED